MSGYLRRLASSAMNPGGAIHPVVGPLFLGSKYNSAMPAVEEETVVTPAQPEHALSESAEGQPAHLPAHHQEFSMSPPEPLIARQERPGVHAHGSAGNKIVISKRSPELVHQAKPVREESDPRTTASEPIQPPTIFAVEKIRHRDHFQPVLLEESIPQRAPQERAAARNSVAKSTQAAPNEIQIHIGRIEVTAAAPPARAQPKAAPKSPSLAEYLKRGRSR